jgi:type I restriction enzyme S subunit
LAEQRRIVARIRECMERVDEIEKLSETSAPEVKALSRSFYREQYQRLCAEHEVCRLDQAAMFMGGGTPSKQNPSFWTGSIPWISPKDMKRRDLHDATDHISDAAISGSSAKLISEPSVLFVVRGMILTHTLPIAVNRVPVAINQDMKAAVPGKGFDVDFLATMLRGAEKTLLAEVEIAGHGTCRLQQPHWSGVPIPVLSPAKRADVVAAAQAFESIADRLLTEMTLNERSAMRAAVLRKAFAGEM